MRKYIGEAIYFLGRFVFEVSTILFYVSGKFLNKELEVYYETSWSFKKYNITLRRKANED